MTLGINREWTKQRYQKRLTNWSWNLYIHIYIYIFQFLWLGQNIYGSKWKNIEAILGTASESYLDFLQSKEAEEWPLMWFSKVFVRLTQFMSLVSLYTTWKQSENQRFCDVLREYRKRPVTWNGLIKLMWEN